MEFSSLSLLFYLFATFLVAIATVLLPHLVAGEEKKKKEQLVTKICRLVHDIEEQLKSMKLVPNQISESQDLLFTENDVRYLREAAEELESNRRRTDAGLAIGSSMRIAGGVATIAGLLGIGGGPAGALFGFGRVTNVIGGTVLDMSIASRFKTEKSCKENIRPTLEKVCSIPHVLQGIVYCYGPFLPSIQEGRTGFRAHLDRLDESKLENVRQIAAHIRDSISRRDHKITLKNLLHVSEASKKLLGTVFGKKENWIDPENENKLLEVIEAMLNFAVVNDIESLKHLTSAMTVVKLSGSVTLGLLTRGITCHTDNSKTTKAQQVADICAHMAGVAIDATILAGTVANMLQTSPSELAVSLRDIASMIERFMEVRDF